MIVLDYIGTISKAWTEVSIFDYKILNIIPIESFSWGFLFLYLTLIVWGYFFDRYPINRISRNIKFEIALAAILFVIFILLLLFAPGLLIVEKFYLWFTVIMLLATAIGFSRHPKLFTRVLLCTVYLFVPWLIHELVALKTGQWLFENLGQHIGYVSIGNLFFPVEELLWMVLVVPFVILLHEYFADNNK